MKKRDEDLLDSQAALLAIGIVVTTELLAYKEKRRKAKDLVKALEYVIHVVDEAT